METLESLDAGRALLFVVVDSWTLNSLNGRSLKSGSWDSGSGRLGLPSGDSGPSAKKRSSAISAGRRCSALGSLSQSSVWVESVDRGSCRAWSGGDDADEAWTVEATRRGAVDSRLAISPIWVFEFPGLPTLPSPVTLPVCREFVNREL